MLPDVTCPVPGSSWMIADAVVDLPDPDSPTMALIYPSIILTVTVLAFILLGELIRDALDPRARARR